MALKIKQNNDTFFIEGSINAGTVKQFKNHLEFLMFYTRGLTINIDGVKEIDANGMKVLRALSATALINNKPFEIIGYGSKEIYDDLQYHNAAKLM